MSLQIHKVLVEATAGIDWNALQEQLNAAHEEVRSLAIAGGQNGVLVARHRHNTFTIAESPDVPYGMTYERDHLKLSAKPDERGPLCP